ncbi:MAG: TIM barrel protein [Clostridiaceae bacterium]|nr:TIM barrel protein [Clostridiaceae bacterium]
MDRINLQLYSVREDAEKDFRGTLERVARTGFTGVEFAGFYGVDAKTMKKWLDEFGLEAVSSHSNVFGNLDEEIEYLCTVGAKHIVLPSANFENRDLVLKLAEDLNNIGEKCKQNGLSLGYHNHSFEFKKDEDGKWLLDVLFENTDPDLVSVQLDVCWALVGGVNPVEYLKKYKDRALTVHMKEVKTVSPYEGTAIGLGIVDFAGIYNLLGDECDYIIEQEGIAMDTWEGLAMSVDYLRKI